MSIIVLKNSHNMVVTFVIKNVCIHPKPCVKQFLLMMIHDL